MCHDKKKFVRFIPVILGILALAALVVMLLWNWLMPMLFGLPTLGYLEALGVLILSKILFSGHGRSHHAPPRHTHPEWKEAFERKFCRSSDDQSTEKPAEKAPERSAEGTPM